jgi:NET1-associated nuclear protein 1 (U3 small nucleolar RNA-associated protein 17)
MYSPASSRLITELEISPSNRVSRRDDTPLEHARVDFVVADPSGRWMVTIDSRSAVLASTDKREAYMKFWEWKEGTWILNTRIDGPHGESKVVDLAFQPSALGSNLFASSGEDGVVRLWNLVEVKSKQGTEGAK